MKALSEDRVRVRGSIVEVTSTGIVARQPIELQVEQGEESWLIASLPWAPGCWSTANGEYGFDFYLPESWAGYRVLQDTWESTASHRRQRETGPLITLAASWGPRRYRDRIPSILILPRTMDLGGGGLF